MKNYCLYCKDEINIRAPYTVDEHGRIYHPECYNQMNTYTDEFGTASTDEFGNPIEEGF